MKNRIIDDKLLFNELCNMIKTASNTLSVDVVNYFSRCMDLCTNNDEKDLLSIIIKNAKKAHNESIALCQDTGFCIFHVSIGHVKLTGDLNITQLINKAVSHVYTVHNLRPSIIDDPLLGKNTKDNTPAFIHIEENDSDVLEILFMAKGGGSENASSSVMLNPSDGFEGIKNFVINAVKQKGANACPPLIVGIGVGGTADACAWAAKKALFKNIGEKNPNSIYANYEQEIKQEINKLGIGTMGLGGSYTAIDVFIEQLPRHIATLPVAVSFMCHSIRRGKIKI